MVEHLISLLSLQFVINYVFEYMLDGDSFLSLCLVNWLKSLWPVDCKNYVSEFCLCSTIYGNSSSSGIFILWMRGLMSMLMLWAEIGVTSYSVKAGLFRLMQVFLYCTHSWSARRTSVHSFFGFTESGVAQYSFFKKVWMKFLRGPSDAFRSCLFRCFSLLCLPDA